MSNRRCLFNWDECSILDGAVIGKESIVGDRFIGFIKLNFSSKKLNYGVLQSIRELLMMRSKNVCIS